MLARGSFEAKRWNARRRNRERNRAGVSPQNRFLSKGEMRSFHASFYYMSQKIGARQHELSPPERDERGNCVLHAKRRSAARRTCHRVLAKMTPRTGSCGVIFGVALCALSWLPTSLAFSTKAPAFPSLRETHLHVASIRAPARAPAPVHLACQLPAGEKNAARATMLGVAAMYGTNFG